MNGLTHEQVNRLGAVMAERKQRLLEETRRALARTNDERYADLLAGGGDAGDVSVASLPSDVAQAEVGRDVAEVCDLNAAEGRIATGRYGRCIDCACAIGYRRLEAYPTAKRCLACQQIQQLREMARGAPRL